MACTDPNKPTGWTKGKAVRVCESLPPVQAEMEYHDPEVREAQCSTGRFVRVCESLPTVTVEMEPVSPTDL
jgi:hypothetical protein